VKLRVDRTATIEALQTDVNACFILRRGEAKRAFVLVDESPSEVELKVLWHQMLARHYNEWSNPVVVTH
jgi:acyl carrier protein phosphodiesterase